MKIGDKVKIVCSCGCCYNGLVGEIVSIGNSIEGTSYLVTIEGKTRIFNKYEVEII